MECALTRNLGGATFPRACDEHRLICPTFHTCPPLCTLLVTSIHGNRHAWMRRLIIHCMSHMPCLHVSPRRPRIPLRHAKPAPPALELDVEYLRRGSSVGSRPLTALYRLLPFILDEIPPWALNYVNGEGKNHGWFALSRRRGVCV